MGSEAPLIDVRGVRFGYGEQPVLDGVDLAAEPGQVVGLLGPNGSGKSTLISLISGLLQPSAGQIRFAGDDLRRLSRRALARRLAVVPQEPEFSFPFSALEIVLMGRHPHLAGLAFESEADIALAMNALEQVGIGRLAGRSIHALSSGERQRVVFARALAQQPECLLLDEPASFLDIRHQVQLYDIVRGLARERGRAVITVLHDLNLAAEYCDRIVLLHAGRVAASGPTAEVFTYANLTRVYETEVYVDTNALTGTLLVIPLSGRVQRRLHDRDRGAGDGDEA